MIGLDSKYSDTITMLGWKCNRDKAVRSAIRSMDIAMGLRRWSNINKLLCEYLVFAGWCVLCEVPSEAREI